MRQKTLDDFETSGVSCPVCSATFKSNKGFGPHFRAKHPDKDATIERIRSAYGGDPKRALEVWYWEDGMSERKISDVYNIPRDGLARAFNQLDVDKELWENQHATFQTNANGYEMWDSYDPDGVNRLMKVHRLLAVAKYGVEEVKDMDVHHTKPIPWLNTYANITLETPEEHLRKHYQEREIDDQGRFV